MTWDQKLNYLKGNRNQFAIWTHDFEASNNKENVHANDFQSCVSQKWQFWWGYFEIMNLH